MKTDKVHTAMLELTNVDLADQALWFKVNKADKGLMYSALVSADMFKFALKLYMESSKEDEPPPIMLMCEFSLSPEVKDKRGKVTDPVNIKQLHAFTHSNSERSYRIRNV